MLKGKEASPVGLFTYNTTNMTNPFSVKDYVDKLPEESQTAVKSYLANNLTYMLYLKRLESILDLYDCYDAKDESKFRSSFNPSINLLGTTANLFAVAISALYLRRSKLPLLQFNTYVDKLYPFLFVYGSSYFGFKMIYGLGYRRLLNLDDYSIVNAKSKLHTDCIKINNLLRFSLADTY